MTIPVSIRFSYGASNFIKAIAWPREFKPLREWPKDYVKAIGLWWDAYRWRGSSETEAGGLVVEEPRSVPRPQAARRERPVDEGDPAPLREEEA